MVDTRMPHEPPAALHGDEFAGASRRPLTFWLLLIALLIVPACAAIGLYLWPRTEIIYYGPKGYHRYYGLGWHNGPGFLGKNWYYAQIDNGIDGIYEYQLKGAGWTEFRATYPDGALMAEGTCWVDYEDDGTPIPNDFRLLNAKYFDPAGRLASQVVDGFGRPIYYYPDGTVSATLEIEDERANGAYAVFLESGTPRHRGRSEDGREVGMWLTFHNDGSLERITDYSVDPPTTVEYERGERVLSDEEIAELLAE